MGDDMLFQRSLDLEGLRQPRMYMDIRYRNMKRIERG